MTLIDVTIPIRSGMFVYPGNPEVRLERAQSIADGAGSNVTRLDFGVHTGTHVDAQVHFLEGAEGAETIPLDAMIGPAIVVDGTSLDGDAIDATALQGLDLPDRAERLLLKTPNSRLWEHDEFTRDFLRLDESGAQLLIGLGVRLVGIDYLSIGDAAAHRALLGSGVVPLEGLDLREVDPGRYELICLPLPIVDSDGSPARALLRPA